MSDQPTPITKQDGVTNSERYLHRLATRTFLSLWSYPAVYRNVGPAGGHGKEVCDLLVVFRNDIIIFSDKDCDFPNTGDVHIDWGRWYRKAILKSAQQVRGAERFIRENPNRLFIDRACTQPFPIQLPFTNEMQFHRVVVAHGTRDRCRAHMGEPSTLRLNPGIVGKAHYEDGCEPFTIGDIDPAKGFVHVLDDISLDTVLGHLDTASDFISYLTKKEAFFRSGKLESAGGEDDLMVYYLSDVNEQNEHDFIFPADAPGVIVQPGQWQQFVTSDIYRRQQEANQISQLWDHLIEEFAKHILGGTSTAFPDFDVIQQEQVVRMMAAECRTSRRVLSESLREILNKVPADKGGARCMTPPRPGSPYYVFVLYPQGNMEEQQYRELRRNLIEDYCMVTKLLYPDALAVVGLATESGMVAKRSWDAVYLDASEWTPKMERTAKVLHENGILKKTSPAQRSVVPEYPE